MTFDTALAGQLVMRRVGDETAFLVLDIAFRQADGATLLEYLPSVVRVALHTGLRKLIFISRVVKVSPSAKFEA